MRLHMAAPGAILAKLCTLRPLTWCRLNLITALNCHNSLTRRRLSHVTCAVALPHADVLERQWLLPKPDTPIRRLEVGSGNSQFYIIQDDLLHPVLGGNKLRKLDGLLPELQAKGCTDVLTCGGVQSAHTAAVAAACAEHGIKAHLLVRGEPPAVPTGFHLLARMYGQVTYVSRTQYADRDAMLRTHAEQLHAHAKGDMQVHVLPEGAGEAAALLGCIRLVHWLAQPAVLGSQPLTLVLDCGTGTTATGLAVGIQLAQLPWQVHGVMLAGPLSYYQQQQTMLTGLFADKYLKDELLPQPAIEWTCRSKPRRFGKIFQDDVQACREVAQQHGILLDPIYSLAAWEAACKLAGRTGPGISRVAMLHTGGTLGLQGLAQRHPAWF